MRSRKKAKSKKNPLKLKLRNTRRKSALKKPGQKKTAKKSVRFSKKIATFKKHIHKSEKRAKKAPLKLVLSPVFLKKLRLSDKTPKKSRPKKDKFGKKKR